MSEGIEERLASAEEAVKSCKRRLDAVEKQQDAIHELAASIKVMASEQKHQTEAINQVRKDVTRLDGKVDALEMKPGKRWEAIVDKLIWAVAGAVVAYLLANIGIAG